MSSSASTSVLNAWSPRITQVSTRSHAAAVSKTARSDGFSTETASPSALNAAYGRSQAGSGAVLYAFHHMQADTGPRGEVVPLSPYPVRAALSTDADRTATGRVPGTRAGSPVCPVVV